MNQRSQLPMPDVQGSPDVRRLAIDKVGIKSIRHPMKILERAGAQHIEMAIDCGLPQGYAADVTPARPARDELLMLWAGRFEQRKALPLALEAIARTRAKVRLLVAGEGGGASSSDVIETAHHAQHRAE